MKMTKMVAALSAAALAVTSLSLAAFADTPAQTQDVTSNSQFMLKVESTKSDNSKNYDGAYAGSGSVKTLTLDGSKIQASTDGASNALAFFYAVGPIDDTYEIGDELTVTVTGLTIKAQKDSVDDETLVNNQDVTWTQTKADGYWSGDKALTISTNTYDDIDAFKASGSAIVATWSSLTVTVPKEEEESGSGSSSSSAEPEAPASGDYTETETLIDGVNEDWVTYTFTHDVEAGDVITFTYSDRGSVDDPTWAKIIAGYPEHGDEIFDSLSSNEYKANASGTVSFTVTAAHVTALDGAKMTVQAHQVKITKIAVAKASGEAEVTTAATTAGGGAVSPIGPGVAEEPTIR
ncbi:MAG: hypothetical protein NC203_07675, partial [Firmicutes bacterium]|nr:hypothetical protein [[Eubacterium] siraeum]MCM1488228.1 hypothetical protein [Bacillota bacterium]